MNLAVVQCSSTFLVNNLSSVSGSFKLFNWCFLELLICFLLCMCFHHLHLLTAFDVSGFIFSIVNISKVLIYCTNPLKKSCLYFRRCLNTFIVSPFVCPDSGQNRQEGICPLVNQFSIYNFPRRGRALWWVFPHTSGNGGDCFVVFNKVLILSISTSGLLQLPFRKNGRVVSFISRYTPLSFPGISEASLKNFRKLTQLNSCQVVFMCMF